MAPWIISHFPDHRLYVEPFGGAASVLLRKPRSFAEVYNDLWSAVVNVFAVMRDPTKAAQLERSLRLTPFSREEFVCARATDMDSDVEAARKTILRSFAGFASASSNPDYPTGFRANSYRSHTTAARDWVHYPDHIAAFTERLKGVIIECRDASQVIAAHDDQNTLIYCDPPYPHETRTGNRANGTYACEMTTQDHERLAEQLRASVAMVIVSTYPGELYDRLYVGWHREERTALADGARRRTEVLYLNEACWSRERQRELIQ